MRRRVQRVLTAALRPVGFHDAEINTSLEDTQVGNLCYERHTGWKPVLRETHRLETCATRGTQVDNLCYERHTG